MWESCLNCFAPCKNTTLQNHYFTKPFISGAQKKQNKVVIASPSTWSSRLVQPMSQSILDSIPVLIFQGFYGFSSWWKHSHLDQFVPKLYHGWLFIPRIPKHVQKPIPHQFVPCGPWLCPIALNYQPSMSFVKLISSNFYICISIYLSIYLSISIYIYIYG